MVTDTHAGKNKTGQRESIGDCFARNLRQLRRDRGFTQERLAHACGISLVFLQNLEAGRRWVSPQTVSSLAHALKVDESDFFQKANTQTRTDTAPSEWRHIPEDIRSALVKVCSHPSWPWDAFRMLLLGFEHTKSPYKQSARLAHPEKTRRH